MYVLNYFLLYYLKPIKGLGGLIRIWSLKGVFHLQIHPDLDGVDEIGLKLAILKNWLINKI